MTTFQIFINYQVVGTIIDIAVCSETKSPLSDSRLISMKRDTLQELRIPKHAHMFQFVLQKRNLP